MSPRCVNDEKMKVYDMKTTLKTTKDEIRYAELWVEIESPKLLKDMERKE